MHLAKGLEFHTVIVVACDDETYPDRDVIDTFADEVVLDNAKRHLLSIICTRSQVRLVFSTASQGSDLMADPVYDR